MERVLPSSDAMKRQLARNSSDFRDSGKRYETIIIEFDFEINRPNFVFIGRMRFSSKNEKPFQNIFSFHLLPDSAFISATEQMALPGFFPLPPYEGS